MLTIKKELGFNDLYNECWSGAINTLQTIEANEKEEELIELLTDMMGNDIPTITTINDFLWFESDYIFELLGIEED